MSSITRSFQRDMIKKECIKKYGNTKNFRYMWYEYSYKKHNEDKKHDKKILSKLKEKLNRFKEKLTNRKKERN